MGYIYLSTILIDLHFTWVSFLGVLMTLLKYSLLRYTLKNLWVKCGQPQPLG